MPVLTAQLPLPPVDVAEALRCAGVKNARARAFAAEEQALVSPDGQTGFAPDGPADGLEGCLAKCLAAFAPLDSGRVCWTVCPLALRQDEVLLGNTTQPGIAVHSAALAKNLRGCRRAVVFAATVGLLPDRLVRRFSMTDMAAALLVQGIGAERVEALCDAFCQKLAAEYGGTRPRFSPGYGDLPLALQRDIFALLDCGRRIGVTLGDSLLMTPTKSVTAIVGLTGEGAAAPAGDIAGEHSDPTEATAGGQPSGGQTAAAKTAPAPTDTTPPCAACPCQDCLARCTPDA